MSDETKKYAQQIPQNESDRYALVHDRHAMWEYALFGSVLLDQLRSYEPQWRDYVVGYVAEVGPRIPLDALIEFFQDMTSRNVMIITNFNKLLAGDAWTKAMGEPGEPGDPMLIEHLARRIIDIYGDMIAWAATMRSARVPTEAEHLRDLYAQFVDAPLLTVREFVAEFVRRLDDILTKLAAGPLDEKVELAMNIKLDIPDEITSAAKAELERVGQLIADGM